MLITPVGRANENLLHASPGKFSLWCGSRLTLPGEGKRKQGQIWSHWEMLVWCLPPRHPGPSRGPPLLSTLPFETRGPGGGRVSQPRPLVAAGFPSDWQRGGGRAEKRRPKPKGWEHPESLLRLMAGGCRCEERKNKQTQNAPNEQKNLPPTPDPHTAAFVPGTVGVTEPLFCDWRSYPTGLVKAY